MIKSLRKSCLQLALLFVGLVVPLGGCSPSLRPSGPVFGQTPYFIPPTPYVEPSPTPLPTATSTPVSMQEGNTSEEPCVDNLTFLSDVTIPDGTEVEANSTLDKRWEVENSGNCNWQEGYRVRLIAGPDMGAQPEQALYPARSSATAVLRLVFKAPEEPGIYKSAWQAVNPHGEPFGDPFFIEIVVK